MAITFEDLKLIDNCFYLFNKTNILTAYVTFENDVITLVDKSEFWSIEIDSAYNENLNWFYKTQDDAEYALFKISTKGN